MVVLTKKKHGSKNKTRKNVFNSKSRKHFSNSKSRKNVSRSSKNMRGGAKKNLNVEKNRFISAKEEENFGFDLDPNPGEDVVEGFGKHNLQVAAQHNPNIVIEETFGFADPYAQTAKPKITDYIIKYEPNTDTFYDEEITKFNILSVKNNSGTWNKYISKNFNKLTKDLKLIYMYKNENIIKINNILDIDQYKNVLNEKLINYINDIKSKMIVPEDRTYYKFSGISIINLHNYIIEIIFNKKKEIDLNIKYLSKVLSILTPSEIQNIKLELDKIQSIYNNNSVHQPTTPLTQSIKVPGKSGKVPGKSGKGPGKSGKGTGFGFKML